MAKACSQRTISVAYPKHWPAPEDLLDFIESTGFTAKWSQLGLDDEDDLESLQLCIMAHPEGDELVAESNGLRIHRHFLQRASGVSPITAYYGYFPDYGIVYLSSLEPGSVRVRFSPEDLLIIAESLIDVENELERLKTIRVRNRSVKKNDGGCNE